MRLEPLYRLEFGYEEAWRTEARGELHRLLFAEGRCRGRVNGRLRGANRARMRADGAWLPHLDAAVETDDGVTILIQLTGLGRPEAEPAREIVGLISHAPADARYDWLNDVVGVVAGRAPPRGPEARIELEVAELVWESPGPLSSRP